jgi:hypothetical protein
MRFPLSVTSAISAHPCASVNHRFPATAAAAGFAALDLLGGQPLDITSFTNKNQRVPLLHCCRHCLLIRGTVLHPSRRKPVQYRAKHALLPRPEIVKPHQRQRDD